MFASLLSKVYLIHFFGEMSVHAREKQENPARVKAYAVTYPMGECHGCVHDCGGLGARYMNVNFVRSLGVNLRVTLSVLEDRIATTVLTRIIAALE